MIKKAILVAATAALAFAALPALAAAQSMDLPENSAFTVEGGTTNLETAELGVECTSVSGEGTWETGTTGTLTLLFHGCTDTITHFFSCNSPGQSAGTIETTHLPFHLVTVEEEEESTVAMLITPDPESEEVEGGTTHFASFKCSFLVNAQVYGNGVLGKVTSPGYNEASNSMELEFASENGEQEFKTVVGDEETEYNLKTTLDGGETFEEAGQDGTGTASFVEEGKGTLTE